MTEPLGRPPRKDPVKRTRTPLHPPSSRSRAGLALSAIAATGRFALQACAECGRLQYPPRDVCGHCLGSELVWRDIAPIGQVIATTTVRTSIDPYFRERTPWRIATVVLDAGPIVVAHLHGDAPTDGPVRLELHLDKAGQAAFVAFPRQDTPNMQDDRQLREMTCDPKFRRVLVTDGRSAAGQAVVRALVQAGAGAVFVGVSDPWKRLPGQPELAALPGVEFVPLNLDDSLSVSDLAASIGGRVDILVNTADHARPGGLLDRRDLVVAREEIETGYFGLLRLAQAFGPTLRARGADGVLSATAWVNLVSVYAQTAWPRYGLFSATQAALLSASQTLRAELRPGGVRVIDVFHGPLDTEWFQEIPPPKVAPDAVARAVIEALRRGVEEAVVGDVAADVVARLNDNPRLLQRELAQ